ncbi:MAG: hypothetical protein KJ914_13040 [Gammaproteobacteria bacterium]|nr:hypothetical protein [Gammaproteobacteria bacterium]MBU1724855.1 hypothetical protein [Gammaproteobacteria bacterium]MBU2005039.1 hypothetical protein [Gammaproteobacteria bacterium]
MKLIIEGRIGFKAQPIKDSQGSESALYLSKNNVCIGTEPYPRAKLHIVDTPKDSNGNIVIIGDTNSSNLRLGYHKDYTWIQSHGLKPLFINELGNNTIINKTNGNVGIGTNSPLYKLDVHGTIKAKDIILSGVSSPSSTTRTYSLSIDNNGSVYIGNSELECLKKKIETLENELLEIKRLILK